MVIGVVWYLTRKKKGPKEPTAPPPPPPPEGSFLGGNKARKFAEASPHLPERVAETLSHLPPRPAPQGSVSEGREMNKVQRTPPRILPRQKILINQP